jgi:catechol 2,3-dioxygenase-like lactoylglutathione lyase family enzyme
MAFGPIIPILRIFDEAKARDFYVGFLGFTVDWEHRFEPGTPLYMQVSREGCVLHLSEHFGDGTPGSVIRVGSSDLAAYQAELLAKKYKYARPGIEDQPWGKDMSISDPFGNQLVFTNIR